MSWDWLGDIKKSKFGKVIDKTIEGTGHVYKKIKQTGIPRDTVKVVKGARELVGEFVGVPHLRPRMSRNSLYIGPRMPSRFVMPHQMRGYGVQKQYRAYGMPGGMPQRSDPRRTVMINNMPVIERMDQFGNIYYEPVRASTMREQTAAYGNPYYQYRRRPVRQKQWWEN